MDTTDPSLPGKYQKLLSEFSKLKNQLILLNKGLTEEQNKSKSLQQQLAEQNHLLKQLREESDGREFRNQQLSRRVSVLQDELNQPLTGSEAPDASTFSIFDAELTSKISEISHLHHDLQNLAAENESLRETNKAILLRHSEDQCLIKQQEDVVRQQKALIDDQNERQSAAMPDLQTNQIVDKSVSCHTDQAPDPDLSFVCSRAEESPSRVTESDPLSGESKAALENRISFLTDSIEAADAKAALFGSECQRMKQRLLILNEQKESESRELSETRQLLQKLRDELNTNVRNYETQLETMSEHLATMNEKWSKQQIEMDSLRQSVNLRRSSKTH